MPEKQSENQTSKQDFSDFRKMSAEAEYVERRRTQNRIAQRTYRKNERKRLGLDKESNNEQTKESPRSTPASTSGSTPNPTPTAPVDVQNPYSASSPRDKQAQYAGQFHMTPPQDNHLTEYDYMQTQPQAIPLGPYSAQPYPYSTIEHMDPYTCQPLMNTSLNPSIMAKSAPTPVHTPNGSRKGTHTPTASQSVLPMINTDYFAQFSPDGCHHSMKSPSATEQPFPTDCQFPPQVSTIEMNQIHQLMAETDVDAYTYPEKLPPTAGGTALHKAAYYGHETVAQLLLDEGADPNATNANGCTALHLAAQRGYQSIVEMLVRQGGEINAKGYGGRTPLHTAAESDLEPIVWFLVKNRADIEARDFAGQTALHRAAERGWGKVVRLLIQYGADINSQSYDEP